MRVLLVIPHYFRSIEKPVHSSNNENYLTKRKQALIDVLTLWRANFGEFAELNIDKKVFCIHEPTIEKLDIIILRNEENHLLDQSILDTFSIKKTDVITDNPKMLPFGSYQIFSREKKNYDWFIYSEDDLALRDPQFFIKQNAFQKEFGYKRLLQPNRYELNLHGPRMKTFIDGELSKTFFDHWITRLEDSDALTQKYGQTNIQFKRAKNPHSGFFCLSQEQFEYWESKDYFLNLDSSFVSPLESAATLGILKTFSIYKPWPNMSFLEIEHLDNKFSNMSLQISTEIHRGQND
jgi:hypothetical protein